LQAKKNTGYAESYEQFSAGLSPCIFTKAEVFKIKIHTGAAD
jgi:hypothetical protein